MPYVYEYLRAHQSRNGTAGSPYYVGKGTGPRAFVRHRGISLPSKDRILIVADNLTEAEAISLEIALIAKYGRIDLGTGR